MTVAFVHGVPETAAIWDELLARLGHDDAVTLSPPGFGAPVPVGFEPTAHGYAEWLLSEVEPLAARSGSEVDLVGHDWGGGHVIGAATLRPDLIGRVVTDIAGTADPAYVWHDLARVWQTPGDGEAFVSATAAMTIDERVEALVGAGMSEAGARACAPANDEVMGACILSLYRSATQPRMARWGAAFEAVADRVETLVIAPELDHYTGGVELARASARRWDATVVELGGLGHWWMLEDPDRGAEVLARFLG